MTNVEKADAGAHSTGDELPCVQWLGLKSNIIADTVDLRQHFVLRYETCDGFYLVGPFESANAAGDWGVENEGLSPSWLVVHIDPNSSLPVEPPGEIPEYEPDPRLYNPDFDDPRRWRPPQGAIGAFYLFLSEVPCLVGPFTCERDTHACGKAYEQRYPDWFLVWVDDPTARPKVLTPEQGVIEAERRDAAEMRERNADFED